MKYFSKTLSVLVLVLIVIATSCSKSDSDSSISLRDYQEQYEKDIDTIDYFIDNYSMTVSPDFDVTFTKITAQNPGTSIRNQTDYALEFKYIEVENQDITTPGQPDGYKMYYINFREGNNLRPSKVDSVYASYKGVRINNDVFDQADNPAWLPLYATIRGWQEAMPMFKTGIYTSGGGPNPVTFSDFGAGVIFLPSGLGYYSQTRTNLPSYSPLIFSFKLLELSYIDHDRDGILSKDETDLYNDATEVPDGDDILKVDTDSDGTINLLDVDDDGDGIKTKYEIHTDGSGNIIFEDCDNDGIPNYLDADSNGQTCN